DLADGTLLNREAHKNERIRVITRIDTPAHSGITETTTYEVGLRFSEQRYIAPSSNDREIGAHIYYTSIGQYQSQQRTGEMVSAWATADPLRVEQGLRSEEHTSELQSRENLVCR